MRMLETSQGTQSEPGTEGDVPLYLPTDEEVTQGNRRKRVIAGWSWSSLLTLPVPSVSESQL